jgi:hypothetical protein
MGKAKIQKIKRLNFSDTDKIMPRQGFTSNEKKALKSKNSDRFYSQ